MEVEIFTLSDYAENYHGKMIIMGTFDVIHSQNFPHRQPLCALSMRLRFSDNEAGTHDLMFRIIDGEGNEIAKVNGDFVIPNPDPRIGYSTFNHVVKFGNLEFKKPGRYSIELYLDGEWKTGLPVNLLKIQGADLKAA